MRIIWHSVIIPEYDRHLSSRLKKMPGMISDKGMFLSQSNMEQNKTAKVPIFTRQKKDQFTSCSARNVIFSILSHIFYILFIAFHICSFCFIPNKGGSLLKRLPFFPSRFASMTCSLTSKYRTNLTKTCRIAMCKEWKEMRFNIPAQAWFLSRHSWKRSEVLHDQIEVGKGGDAKLSLRSTPATWRNIQKMKECMSKPFYQNLGPEGPSIGIPTFWSEKSDSSHHSSYPSKMLGWLSPRDDIFPGALCLPNKRDVAGVEVSLLFCSKHAEPRHGAAQRWLFLNTPQERKTLSLLDPPWNNG